ncbi:MAG TPA: hypothetical protein VH458_15440 [Vicinamibacterales bacterium]|jgi:hypothetical protein
MEPPSAALERALIDDFVRAQGYDPRQLARLPHRIREDLLRRASEHASVRLTEVESRSQFVHEIHGTVVD